MWFFKLLQNNENAVCLTPQSIDNWELIQLLPYKDMLCVRRCSDAVPADRVRCWQVLYSVHCTVPEAQNRAVKSSTLLRRRSTLPIIYLCCRVWHCGAISILTSEFLKNSIISGNRNWLDKILTGLSWKKYICQNVRTRSLYLEKRLLKTRYNKYSAT